MELRRGKQYFPKMNAIRLWLSKAAWVRDPGQFAQSFETALRIAGGLDLKVVACLFNRWHNDFIDCGGIYIDHFMPGWSWMWAAEGKSFLTYVNQIAGEHKRDERVLIWDVCYEPFSYSIAAEQMKQVETAEYNWLEGLYKACKETGAEAPVSVSIHSGDVGRQGRKGTWLDRVEPLSDVLLIHPYYNQDQDNEEAKAEYIAMLDHFTDVRQKTGKPMLVTETCWGSLDDDWRVANMRYTLGELVKRDLGWLAHALHHSGVADLHRPEYGPVGRPGNLAFIEADGSLRKGHEVFNEF